MTTKIITSNGKNEGNFQTSWIIYPNCVEHAASKGFEGHIPPIGTKICIDKYVYFVHEHVMYYDKGKPILSIRAREARPHENHFFEKI